MDLDQPSRRLVVERRQGPGGKLGPRGLVPRQHTIGKTGNDFGPRHDQVRRIEPGLPERIQPRGGVFDRRGSRKGARCLDRNIRRHAGRKRERGEGGGVGVDRANSEVAGEWQEANTHAISAA